jgi:phosphatidylglycerophosphate synthase
VLKELKQLNTNKGGIFENLIYRHFSIRITRLLIYTKITPNQITGFSLILAFIAAIFYFRADYASLVIGTIFLNLSYLLDCVDGELARYKKLNSAFGAWWDLVCDKITEYAIFASLTLGLYFRTTDPTILILGFFALANDLMIIVIRLSNRVHFDKQPSHEFPFGKKRYLESVATFTVLTTVATLLNKVYYLLLIYAVLGALIWIRQIFRQIKNKNGT